MIHHDGMLSIAATYFTAMSGPSREYYWGWRIQSGGGQAIVDVFNHNLVLISSLTNGTTLTDTQSFHPGWEPYESTPAGFFEAFQKMAIQATALASREMTNINTPDPQAQVEYNNTNLATPYQQNFVRRQNEFTIGYDQAGDFPVLDVNGYFTTQQSENPWDGGPDGTGVHRIFQSMIFSPAIPGRRFDIVSALGFADGQEGQLKVRFIADGGDEFTMVSSFAVPLPDLP